MSKNKASDESKVRRLEAAKTLRQRADKRLTARGMDVGDMTVEDVRALLHELKVHQIELEATNRNLQAEIAAHRETAVALRQAEEQYRLIGEHVSDVIWRGEFSEPVDVSALPKDDYSSLADRALQGLRFPHVSPGVHRLLGYSPEEAESLPLKAMLTPSSHRVALNVLAEGLVTGQKGFSVELEYVTRDGATGWLDVSLSYLREEGRVVGIAGVSRDITERKRLEKALAEAAEVERRHIGQDLHDGVGQELTGLTLKAETLAEMLAEREAPERELAEEILAALDRTRRAVRQLSQALVPVELDAGGLEIALEELASRIQRMPGVRCTFACRGRGQVIHGHVATQLYRIAQEALANAVTHAKARNIQVGLTRGEATVLTIRDDGVGIPSRSERGEGIGLKSMRYRAGVIGASLQIRPAPSGGTLVICRLPGDQKD